MANNELYLPDNDELCDLLVHLEEHEDAEYVRYRRDLVLATYGAANVVYEECNDSETIDVFVERIRELAEEFIREGPTYDNLITCRVLEATIRQLQLKIEDQPLGYDDPRYTILHNIEMTVAELQNRYLWAYFNRSA